MIWHVFEDGDYCHHNDPRNPGKYLGTIDLPEKWENGIDTNLQKFDIHLRQTKRRAYGNGYIRYFPTFTETKYRGFSI